MSDEIIQQIALDKINCVKQVREDFDEEALVGLAQSLKESGQQQPIRLRPDGNRFAIIMGARRVMAARKAGFATIGAIVERGELRESELLQRQFIENVQREDLTPIEKAKAIERLMKATGWAATLTAAKLGLSNAAVTRLLSLLTLPDEIRAKVASGELSASSAYELARVKDAGQQAQLADQAASGKLNRDALSGAVKANKNSARKAPSTLPARATAKLNEGRSVTVISQSLTLESFIGILEELLARARQARPKGLALDTFLKVLHDQAKLAV